MLNTHIAIFCAVDDFCKNFDKESKKLLLSDIKKKVKYRFLPRELICQKFSYLMTQY